jgi:hypothetical protein
MAKHEAVSINSNIHTSKANLLIGVRRTSRIVLVTSLMRRTSRITLERVMLEEIRMFK